MTQAAALAQFGSTGVSQGFKNRIINGAMVIDQRNAGASISNTNSILFPVDRFAIYGAGSSKFNAQKNAGSVTPPNGFSAYLGITSTAATTPSSGDIYLLRQPIEGFNMADLNWGTANAKTVTLSFWVRSSLTGSFGGCLTNGDVNRSYPYSYTISAANTWEYKTVTIPGPTDGTWYVDNQTGIRVYWNLGAGSSFNGTVNTWATVSDATFPAGSTQVVATNGATFYITGVQLEVGSTATSFDYRPYGTELALCQRYYWKYNNNYIVSGFNENSSGFLAAFTLPTQMRTAPTMGTDASATYRIRVPGATVTVTSVTGDSATVSSLRLIGNTSGGLTVGQGSILIADTNRFLDFSAEL